MAQFPVFGEQSLRQICQILADTNSGLTGTEIGQLLESCGIQDVNPGITKRYRLFDALNSQQRLDRCGNHVAEFVKSAMHPVRYVYQPDLFHERLSDINQVLSFLGLSLGNDGTFRPISPSKTLSDAQARVNSLRDKLQQRNAHADVLRFCRTELLQDNYFHAVFEACKSVAEKIREKSDLTSDGGELVDQAFGFKLPNYPILAFNRLQTKSETSEHRGLMNLLKGLFGTFRNTTAHAPKIKWEVSEQDALDILTLTSLLHRRLDEAVKTRPG